MAGLILDSAGTIKLKVLDDALVVVQRLTGLAEQYAMAVKRGMPTGTMSHTIRRQLQTLAGNLKGQFGMISDAVTNVYITSSRGASEANRARAMKDGLAQIRQAIEIGMAHTKEKHAVKRHDKGGAATQG
jgi:hypothetical protein